MKAPHQAGFFVAASSTIHPGMKIRELIQVNAINTNTGACRNYVPTGISFPDLNFQTIIFPYRRPWSIIQY